MTEEDLTLIEKFITNSLSESDQLLFDEKRSTSREFADELKLQQVALAHVEASEKASMKASMLKDFREVRSKTPDNTIFFTPRRISLSIAASIVLLLGVFSIFNLTTPGYEEAFTAYYTPYDGVVNTRGEETALDEGITAYHEKRYADATSLLTEQKSIDGITNGQQYLLIASCYLELDKPDKSLEWLSKIAASESSLIIANQKWYQSLAYLLKDDITKSKQILKELAEGKSAYQNRASQLLKEEVFQD